MPSSRNEGVEVEKEAKIKLNESALNPTLQNYHFNISKECSQFNGKNSHLIVLVKLKNYARYKIKNITIKI